MAGRFEGLSALEWHLFAAIVPRPPPQRGRGMPHPPFRQLVTTVLYGLSTGCRGCDSPRGPPWAAQRAAQRWWQRWQAEGPRVARPARLLGLAQAHGMLPWPYGALTAAFARGQRRR
jgi:hypothetical protein